jgi:hypothetical protein
MKSNKAGFLPAFAFIKENNMNWLKNRLMERTSWDGGVLIAVGVVALMFQGLIGWAAYGAIAYGIFTLVKSED